MLPKYNQYVTIPDGSIERFLSVINMHNHSGKVLDKKLLVFHKDEGIEIANCRGQSYDNASNMSGKYNGMQANMLKVNPMVMYIYCCAHS